MLDAGQRQWKIPLHGRYRHEQRRRVLAGQSANRFRSRNSCWAGRRIRAADPTAARETTDFEFALDPSGKTLYVIDHQTDAAGTFPQGNALHVLTVAADGMLSESASSPLFLPSNIPAGADPQGVAVIAADPPVTRRR